MLRCRPDAVLFALLLALSAAAPSAAADTPEITRAAASAQADGVLFTLRQIPEACVRMQGAFSGGTPPFRIEVMPTRADCQPRARFLGVHEQAPQGPGWRLNDVIRVPSAHCPGLSAVLTVWRKPATGGAPALDAQGRARIVLNEAMHGTVRATTTPALFAAQFAVTGTPCGQ